MRIQITFELSGKRQVLPLNYQYPLSAWIYSVLSKSDKEFTDFLHSEGYKMDTGKTFKLFSFSRLRFPKGTIKIIPRSDRMEVMARKAFLDVSFALPETAEHFILGLFSKQAAVIGDKISQLEMKVKTVQLTKKPEIDGEKTVLRTLSPMVITNNIEGEKYEEYLSPEDEKFQERFSLNLIDKYKTVCKFRNAEVKQFDKNDIKFKCLTGTPKPVLQRIKAYSQAETKVKGYMFDFELKAPKELIMTGLDAGFGAMSSLGFGYCDWVD